MTEFEGDKKAGLSQGTTV